jgi:hypothetical protein
VTDIRTLLRDAEADLTVGPADPVERIRRGVARRRRVEICIIGLLAAVVAAVIAVPLETAGSSSHTDAAVVVPRGEPLRSVPLYQLETTEYPLQQTHSISLVGRFAGQHSGPVQISDKPVLELHATLAEVVQARGDWGVWLYAPEATNLYQREVSDVGDKPGRSFVAVLDGVAFHATPIQGDKYVDVSLGYGLDESTSVSLARSLTSEVLINPPTR